MEKNYIRWIIIRSIRHLRQILIELSNTEIKHLILTGRNGSGKTSVLEALRDYFVKNQEVFVKMLINNIYSSKDKQFLFVYFPAKRTLETKTITAVEKTIFSHRNKNLSNKLIAFLVDLEFKRVRFILAKKQTEAEQITNWLQNFENLLKFIFEDQSLTLSFEDSGKNYNYILKIKDREPFDFTTLSDGYSSILKIVVELILQIDGKKLAGNPIYEVEGIVLIDEIEAHLHIDLQKKILPFLTTFFPKIQFVVTTHSPFVLNSINNAVIFDLEKQIRVEDLSAYSVEGIIESYYENDLYSQILKQELARYENLLEKLQLSDNEEDEIDNLRKKFKKIPEHLAQGAVLQFQKLEIKRLTQKK